MCFQRILQILKKKLHVVIEISVLKENCSQWQTRQHSNAYCHLTNDQIIMLFCYYEKQTKHYFSDYYKTITRGQKHNMIYV